MDSPQDVERNFEISDKFNDIFGKAETYFKESLDLLGPTYLFPLLISCLLIIVTIFIFIARKRSCKGNNLLLLGLSNSGKTLLYCKLILNQYKDTYTSIKENRGIFSFTHEKTTKSINVIDLPGQESIRLNFFERLKDSAKGIIFLIDSSTFQKDLKDVAEYLYTVLVGLNGQKLPFLIACNKQDVELAKSSNLIKYSLEKELNHVRHTHSANLEGVDGKARSAVYLGNPKKDFSFSDLKGISVAFAELSAKIDDPNALAAIKEWVMCL